MSIIKRKCPLCDCDEYKSILCLKENQFTLNNNSYKVYSIPELGLNPKKDYPIVKCNKCKMIYSLYHLDDNQEFILYKDIISQEKSMKKIMTIGRRNGDHKRWLSLLSLVNKSKPKDINLKVADYGCGWGTFLQTANGPGITTIGFDVTPWKIEYARQHGILICENEEEFINNGPYDLCISTSVLEHLRNPRNSVELLSKILKPDGYAFINCIVVNSSFQWKLIKRKLRKQTPIQKEINPWEHLNYFTSKTFIKLMGEYGFVPINKPINFLDNNFSISELIILILRRLFPNFTAKKFITGFWQLKIK